MRAVTSSLSRVRLAKPHSRATASASATARMRPTAVVSPARAAQQVPGLAAQMIEAGLGRKIRHDVSFTGPRSARQARQGRSP